MGGAGRSYRGLGGMDGRLWRGPSGYAVMISRLRSSDLELSRSVLHGIKSALVARLGGLGRVSVRIGGGSTTNAWCNVGPSSDPHWWLPGHGHVRSGAIPAKQGEERVGLLATQGASK